MTTAPRSGAANLTWSKARRFPRYCTDVRVVVTSQRNGVSQNTYGRCTIIAEGGFGATLAGELRTGEEVDAEVVLVGGRAPVRAGAVVRYQSGFRHGFEFLSITPDQRAVIRDFCAELKYAE